MITTSFESDIKRGIVGEDMMEEIFGFMNVFYQPVTQIKSYQRQDIDFTTQLGTFEIKSSYRDNDMIIVEEFTNSDPQYGAISSGWFKKSKADFIVFVSKYTGTFIILKFNEAFKTHYRNIRLNYRGVRNKPTEYNGQKWQSSYRVIPLAAISGFYIKVIYSGQSANISALKAS